MFTYCEKLDRPILDLQVSSYLRSVIEDDYKAGNNIHILIWSSEMNTNLKKSFQFKGCPITHG